MFPRTTGGNANNDDDDDDGNEQVGDNGVRSGEPLSDKPIDENLCGRGMRMAQHVEKSEMRIICTG